MKHNANHSAALRYKAQPAYPNAADTNYFTAKALEILTAVASGLGCVAGMIFLVMMA